MSDFPVVDLSAEVLPPDSAASNEVEWETNDLLTMNFIAVSRLYDVMMTLLMETDLEKGTHLLGLHAEGSLLMPAPQFNGTFVTTSANASS